MFARALLGETYDEPEYLAVLEQVMAEPVERIERKRLDDQLTVAAALSSLADDSLP